MLRLRIVWDFIVFVLPAIVLLALDRISFRFFSYIVLVVVNAHLLVAPFLIHSWCMKGRYRLRQLQRGIDYYVSRPPQIILVKGSDPDGKDPDQKPIWHVGGISQADSNSCSTTQQPTVACSGMENPYRRQNIVELQSRVRLPSMLRQSACRAFHKLHSESSPSSRDKGYCDRSEDPEDPSTTIELEGSGA